MSKILLCMLLMLIVFGVGWAREVIVDDDSEALEPDGSEELPFKKVGQALEEAVSDATVDIITIYPGTYNENLTLQNYPGNLTLRSTYNQVLNNDEVISSTVIQGLDHIFDSVFYINGCSGTISFWGLSLRNGKGHYFDDSQHPDNWTQGGGICAIGREELEQHINISWCNIYENYACWGGGIYGEYASFTITNANIHDNALFFRHSTLPPDSHGGSYNGPKGGGVYLAGGWSTISKSVIYGNRSFLEDIHPLYNPLCYGNAAALVWRNICDGDDVGMNMEYCEVYDNVTSTLDYQMRIYDWPFRATIQIQRGSHGEGPGEDGYNHVEINNCTITDNQIISQSYGPSDCYINTAVGVVRHTDASHLYGTINNNIVYDNTAGLSLLDQEVLLVQQLYGGFFDTANEFVRIKIPIKYCCVNDALNTNIYINESNSNIEVAPLFVDAENHDYSLRWDVSAISPCIDRGNPSILDAIDGSPCEIGARSYQIAHDYERYAMPRVTGRETIKWMCYPVLNEITEGSCVNESFFEPIVDEQVLEFVLYKPYQVLEEQQMRYEEGELVNGNEIVISTQGYKVKLQDNYPATINIHSPGYLIPPETVVNLHNMTQYGTNWVGYFVRESARPHDALASVLDQLSIIETAKWTMYKLADGSWLQGAKFILNYGDLVILYSDEDCSFVWNNPDPVPPFTLGTPTAFSYTEKPSYTSFFITLPSAKNGELPAEIGLYVNDVCKGAVVVEDSLLHVCAYLDEGEVITPDNSYLVFHYSGTKSGHTNKSIYRMSSKQLTQSKSPTNFYQISISDPQNCSPVSPIAILSQNYPNPFNPSTTISYELPEDGNVQISIYNLKGQLVKHLLNKHESIGPHSVVWDGKDSSDRACSSGMYYYRFTSLGKSISKKMLLLK